MRKMQNLGTRADILRLAAEAQVDPRTAQKFLAGELKETTLTWERCQQAADRIASEHRRAAGL